MRKITKMLMLAIASVMLVITIGMVNVIDAQAATVLGAKEYKITDLRKNKTKTFDGDDGKGKVLLFGGLCSCGHTTAVERRVNNYISSHDIGDIEVYFIDIKKETNTKEELVRYANNNNFPDCVCVASEGSSDDAYYLYCSAGRVTAWKYDLDEEGYWTMPLLCFVDGSGNIVSYTTSSTRATDSVIANGFASIKTARSDGLHVVDGVEYLYRNGVIDTSYNGLYYDSAVAKYKYISRGRVAYEYSDVVYDPSYGWVKIKNGLWDMSYTDLYYSPTIGWWKIAGGVIDTGYTDLYCSPTMGWWKVVNGSIDLGYNDMYCSPTYGWWKIKNGQLDIAYTDLFGSPTIGWWKIVNGTIDFGYTDMYYSPSLGWWKVSGGALDLAYTDMYCSPTMGWWKVNGGQVDLGYTDLYCSPTIGWWKVNGGALDLGYTDFYYSPTIGWWKVSGGQLDLGFYGLYFSPTLGWRKVVSGTVDWNYTGVYNDASIGAWFIYAGQIDFNYNGFVTTDGITYLVTNGHAEPVSYGVKPVVDSEDSSKPEVEPAKPVIEEPVIDNPEEPVAELENVAEGEENFSRYNGRWNERRNSN